MKKKSFLDVLKKQGYEITERKLGGGFVNDVRLVTAHKGEQVYGYVAKKYRSKKDVRDMLRGYDNISTVVKTPTIVYINEDEKEVAYDLVKGKSIKDMILERDKEAPEAVRLLGKELERLHKSKNSPARYRKGNSPDEKKMIRHVIKAITNEQLDRHTANQIIREINRYIPGNKSIIHGDAHLGNFLYSNHRVYFIDPDNVKISDYNADIGKVVTAIDELSGVEITRSQGKILRELFLESYLGEDPQGVKLHEMRTPLTRIKHREEDKDRGRIAKVIRGLEARVASAIIFVILFTILLMNPNNFTGRLIDEINSPNASFYVIVILTMAILAYWVLRKKKVYMEHMNLK